MEDELFKWNFETLVSSDGYFWFEYDKDGNFGYRYSDYPDVFHKWEMERAIANMYTWRKYSPRIELCGPSLSEIPQLILKIRTMEQRHKRYLERKYHV